MKMEHSKFSHMASKEAEGKPVEVVEVRPPEDEAAFMRDMAALANAAPAPQEMLSEPPIEDSVVRQEASKKAALEKLLLFKKPVTTTVNVGGVEFEIKVLTATENNEVLSIIRNLPLEEQATRSQLVLLAAAIVTAGGILLEDTYSGTANVESPIIKKYHEMCSWNISIINTLFEAYDKLIKDTELEYKKDFLENSQRTPTTD